MARRHGLWVGLAALALSGPGPAAGQDATGDIEAERRSRIIQGLGPEFSRVDSIPVVVDGVAHELRAVALVTDRQVCAAMTAGSVTRRDQTAGGAEGTYLSDFLQPRFGLETLDPSDRIGIGFLANDLLLVDARRVKPDETAPAPPTSQDIAAGIEASTKSCHGLSMVKQPQSATGQPGRQPVFPVAVAISLGDQPTLTIIEPRASYTIDREAFRRIDLAVGAGQGSAIPAYAMSLSWWGQ